MNVVFLFLIFAIGSHVTALDLKPPIVWHPDFEIQNPSPEVKSQPESAPKPATMDESETPSDERYSHEKFVSPMKKELQELPEDRSVYHGKRVGISPEMPDSN